MFPEALDLVETEVQEGRGRGGASAAERGGRTSTWRRSGKTELFCQHVESMKQAVPATLLLKLTSTRVRLSTGFQIPARSSDGLHPRLTKRPLHLYTNDASAIRSRDGHKHEVLSLTHWEDCLNYEIANFSFSLLRPRRLQPSTSVLRFRFEDCIFVVCDDTHALSSWR